MPSPAQTFKASLGNATQLGGILGGGTNPFGSLLSSGSTPATTPKSTFVASLTPSTAPVSQPTSSSAVGNPSATTPATPKSTYVNSQVNSPSYATLLANDQASLANGTTPASPFTGGTSTNTTPPVNPNYSFQAPGNPSTPPGSIDPNTPEGQYQLAFQTYLQSLQPSAAETDAEKALAAQTLQASENQDYALNKPGQTLGFASGEAARVAKNDAFQTDALTNTVNADTAAQTANENAAQAAYTNATNLYNSTVKNAAPISVSPGATLFDPNTGQPIYTAPTTQNQNATGGAGDASQLQPYLNTSSSGVPYVDLSHVSASTRDNLAQIAAANGVQVITNTNEAADLTNITNAYSDISTIQDTLAGLTSPNPISRIANDLGVNPIAVGLQTDAQKAASQTIQDAGLDLFKAISGVQGFRGNASILAQIKDNLPTIYDTTDTAAAKLSIVQQLIQNRESAIVGNPAANAYGSSGSTNTSTSSSQPSAFQLPDGTTVYLQGDGSYAAQ